MIRQVTDDGYLKFDTVGAIDRRVLLGKPVLVGPKRVPGWWDSRPTIWSAGRRRSPSPSWTSSISTSEPRTGPGRRRRSHWVIRRPLTVTPETSGRACSRERRWGAGWAAPCCSPSCGMNCPWTVPLSLPPRRRWGPRGLRRGLLRHPGGGAGGGRRGCCGSGRSARPQAGMQLGRRCGAALYGSGRLQTGGSLRRCASWRRPAASPGRPCARWPDAPIRPPSSGPKRGTDGGGVHPRALPRTPSGVTCLRDAEAALALIRAFVGHLAEKE